MNKIKKIAIFSGTFIGAIALGTFVYAVSGGDTFVTQRDPTNSFNTTQILPVQVGDAALVFDSTTQHPVYGTLGSGLSFSDALQMFSVANVPESSITSLTSDLSSKVNASSLATVATSGSYTDLINTPTSPASYQAIISETGTAAPTGTTLVNSYSGTPTFTWARTSAGVYTLTASSAIFNTSGRTGVFIQPLTNLNGAESAVVTSSTVITFTTAVQSLAVIGLLGFTATPTDALLNKTMIYVQTY